MRLILDVWWYPPVCIYVWRAGGWAFLKGQRARAPFRVNTLSPRQNDRQFPDGIFKCIFLNENIWISIKMALKFVQNGPFDNITSLIQIMTGRRFDDKPLSQTMMVSLLTHICVTRPQWVVAALGSSVFARLHLERQSRNSLWPSDAIGRQISGSTLAQVMTCCLTAPNNYLNQCWLIISEVQWHSYQGNFTRDASTINHLNPFENYILKFHSNFARANELRYGVLRWLEIAVNTRNHIY